MANARVFKSRAMLRVEERIGRPLEEYFEESYRSKTQVEMADDLHISNASVSRWMRDLGIETRLNGQRPPESVA